MSGHSRHVTLHAWPITIGGMSARTTIDHEDGPHLAEPESADISDRLQLLARQLGMTQAELGRFLAIDRRTLSAIYTGAKGAGLPLIRRAAKKSGRAVSWLLGEEDSRALLAEIDQRGRLIVDSPQIKAPCRMLFPQAAGAFAAGSEIFVDPCEAFVADEYLIVRPHDASDAWIAFARHDGTLDRLNGELHVYSPTRYAVIGMVVGVVVKPPKPLSA